MISICSTTERTSKVAGCKKSKDETKFAVSASFVGPLSNEPLTCEIWPCRRTFEVPKRSGLSAAVFFLDHSAHKAKARCVSIPTDVSVTSMLTLFQTSAHNEHHFYIRSSRYVKQFPSYKDSAGYFPINMYRLFVCLRRPRAPWHLLFPALHGFACRLLRWFGHVASSEKLGIHILWLCRPPASFPF